MKKTSIEILNAVLTILVGIVTLILCARRKVWLKVSRNILRPHFGIETRAYRKWHDKRSAHIQKLLDKERERQQKYNDTFKAGKCTFGDRDMNRHRDIQYSNVFPCGWHCPHCGMTWVD